MLVAPVLALLAWFGVGELTSEQPAPAQAGRSYPLLERSNCRYDSGQCELRNEDLRLVLNYEPAEARLILSSSHPLNKALMSVGSDGQAEVPQPMLSLDAQGVSWALAMPALPNAKQRLRLAVQRAGVTWYGEAGTHFLEPYRLAGTQ